MIEWSDETKAKIMERMDSSELQVSSAFYWSRFYFLRMKTKAALPAVLVGGGSGGYCVKNTSRGLVFRIRSHLLYR